MERQRYYDRDQFTWEEKDDIAAKSDGRCCHCGAKKYFGYGATVDHFIPLYRGGSNRMINLIMMCKDCNKEKGDKIVDLTYVPYLKDKHKEELEGYLDSYITSLSYIQRNRLFACDQYSVILQNRAIAKMQNRKGSKLKNMAPMGTRYLVKLAVENDYVHDYTRLCDYFERYLKKYDRFYSRDAIRANIAFWMRFGCIYYMERNGEINMMTVFTVQHMPDGEDYKGITKNLNMYIFSYYSTDTAYDIAANIVTAFPHYIIDEQRLKFLNMRINLLEEDKLTPLLLYRCNGKTPDCADKGVNGFLSLPLLILTDDEDPTEKELGQVDNFFKEFDEIETQLTEFMRDDPDSQWADWMLYDILSCHDIKRLGIFNNKPDLTECNEHIIRITDDAITRKHYKETLNGGQ